MKFRFDEFSTAEFSKKIQLECLKSETELEFYFQWGSQKLEPKIRIPNLDGSNAQCQLPFNTSPLLSDTNIKHIQRVIGSILYYALAVNLTVMMALSTIASEQAHGIENMMLKTKQLLNYLATNLDATVPFHESDMILNIHSNASYLSKANTHSRACGHFFMGWKPNPTQPIKLNGAFLPCVQYYGLLLHLPQRQNFKPQFFDSPLKKWDIHHRRHQ